MVVIYMDDMGYADVGCYGSEIRTPNLDALAGRGLRFNHYTTHPICSPARAALLTGRNAHSVSTGWLANNNPGFPGYTGEIPLDAPTIAEAFKAGHYATIGIGKWHNSLNAMTPDHTWPTARGFDRFYGFMEGETSYFFPARLVINNVVAPIDAYPDDYYATDDFTDKAIAYMKDVRNSNAQQPFMLYLAYNAVHGPMQAKEEDLARYKGMYDVGWDVIRAQRLQRQKELGLVPADTQLSPRDSTVLPWDEVPDDHKRLFCRHMETYAAMLDCVDQNVGRLVSFLQDMGELDNTIIIFSSDNGGTATGGPDGTIYFHRRFSGLGPLPVTHDVEHMDIIGTARSPALYPTGWGQASNTPFPSYKSYSGGGGRRVAFIASWPERIRDHGAIRSQFAHVTDVMPTLLDLAGVPQPQSSHGQPAQPPQGASLAPVLLESTAPPQRTRQYYECWANRAYYRDGWIAVSIQKRGQPIDMNQWTLHRHATDFSESVDLAAEFPGQLAELMECFDKEAWANLVYPLDNRTPAQKFNASPAQAAAAASSTRRFLPGGQTVHRQGFVSLIADRSFRVRVRVRQTDGDQGVLFAIGDLTGGMVMYIEDSAVRLRYNGFGVFSSLGPLPVSAGEQEITLEYEALGERKGRGRLVVAHAADQAWEELSPTLARGFYEGLDIGI
ncbi:MAG: arylsulfatase, partial [Cupriavidus necator]